MNMQHLRIKKESQPIWLIYFIVLFPFTFGTLFDLIGLPASLKYLIDISWVFLVVLIVLNLNKDKVFIRKNDIILYVWFFAFLLFTLLTYIFKYQSVLYYLWGFRNNFRFYFAFFAFILFLDKSHIKFIFKAFDIFFWVNTAVCFIQCLLLGINQDYLGGLFGASKGSNGYINIFFVLAIIKTIVFYLNKQEKFWVLLAKCASVLVISAFAELKFFYIEFIIVIAVAVLISDFSFRKLWLVIVGAIGIVLAIILLQHLFPAFFDFFSIDSIIESATKGSYSGTNALNRLTTVPHISEKFFTTPQLKLFGMGLGNCDTSNYSFLNTPFYVEYSYLRYNWFSTAHLYLEVGFIGMTLFFMFFVIVFIKSIQQQKSCPKDIFGRMCCQLSAITAIMAFAITVYNSSIRTEPGYLIYFALSLTFIINKSGENYESNTIDRT